MSISIYNLLASDHVTACIDALIGRHLDEGRGVRLDEPTWIALVAHFLDLRDIHEKSLKKWDKLKPKGIIKDPITITDPETGEPVRRSVPASKRKNARKISEIDPAGFAEWRGIDPVLFTKMVDKYKAKAERFRTTAAHKKTLRAVTRPKAEFSWERRKPGRRPNPVRVFEKIKILAKYLDAKEKNPSLKMRDFSKEAGLNISGELGKYRQEAEAYRSLTKAGEDIEQPTVRKGLTAADRASFLKREKDRLTPHVIQVGKAIIYGRLEGKPSKESIKAYAKQYNLDVKKLTNWYNKLKDKHTIKVEIAKLVGATPPKPPRRGRKPKPKKKVKERPRLQRGSYRPQKTPDAELTAWMSLADDVEEQGLTRALIVKHADLVGVKVIQRVRAFPTSWGTREIKKWMTQNVDEYVSQAGPKIHARLKELGLWNPPKASIEPLPQTTLAPVEEHPWRDLKSWHKWEKPKVVFAVGTEGDRNIRGHLSWLQKYFDVKILKPTSFRAIRSAGADIVIAMTRFIKRKNIPSLENNIPPGTPYIYTSRSSNIGGVTAATVEMKDKRIVPWFVDAYEKEKGTLHASVDWDICNLIEGCPAREILEGQKIKSKGWDGNYVLVHKKTNYRIEKGTKIKDNKGTVTVIGGRAPKHGNSSGKVWLAEKNVGMGGEVHAHVYGLKWLKIK